jgi:hypothetical protein
MMIREKEWEKGFYPELIKDDSQIKVRMFDAEDNLYDIPEADYKEMLAKKTVCSYCGVETATFLNWNLRYTSVGNFMFSFPTCDDHHWVLENNVAHVCMGDWTSVFRSKWEKDNGLKSEGWAEGNYGHIPYGQPYLPGGRISEYTKQKRFLENEINEFVKECEGPQFYGTRECRACYFRIVCKVGQYVNSEPAFIHPMFSE